MTVGAGALRAPAAKDGGGMALASAVAAAGVAARAGAAGGAVVAGR